LNVMPFNTLYKEEGPTPAKAVAKHAIAA
jgi:hypothetical protein